MEIVILGLQYPKPIFVFYPYPNPTVWLMRGFRFFADVGEKKDLKENHIWIQHKKKEKTRKEKKQWKLHLTSLLCVPENRVSLERFDWGFGISCTVGGITSNTHILQKLTDILLVADAICFVIKGACAHQGALVINLTLNFLNLYN